MRLYVCDDQSQNKLIRITILLHKSTSRGKETRVVDALRLKHIFSVFLSVTAHYKVVSTIGKTNTIAIRYVQDHSIQGTRHVMINSNLLPLKMNENLYILKNKIKYITVLRFFHCYNTRDVRHTHKHVSMIQDYNNYNYTKHIQKARLIFPPRGHEWQRYWALNTPRSLMLQWQLIAETVPVRLARNTGKCEISTRA